MSVVTNQTGERCVAGRWLLLTTIGSLLVAAVSACGGSPASRATTTVTATASPSPPPASDKPKSDVVGRAYDFGTIRSVEGPDDAKLIVLDRWTANAIPDDVLGAKGMPVAPYDNAAKPFINQNDKILFRMPVNVHAQFLYRHCVALKEPVQAKSVELAELAKLDAKENLIFVKLNDKGEVTFAQNLPGC